MKALAMWLNDRPEYSSLRINAEPLLAAIKARTTHTRCRDGGFWPSAKRRTLSCAKTLNVLFSFCGPDSQRPPISASVR